MEKKTKIVEAIILKTEASKENDLRVLVYSKEQGKLLLSMKGALKLNSKLIGHVQPLSLSSLMVISGRQGDYIGSAKNTKVYLNIREDFKRLQLAGLSSRLFSYLLKNNQTDLGMFFLIKDWLEFLNKNELSVTKNKFNLYALAFNIKLINLLGLLPDTSFCVFCKKQLSKCQPPYYFSKEGGVFSCVKDSKKKDLQLSLNSLKLMNFLHSETFSLIDKLKVLDKDLTDLSKAITEYMFYEFRDSLKAEENFSFRGL